MEKNRIQQWIRRWWWNAAGAMMFVVAVLGLFLPFVPAAPFALFAGACFARGSEKFHQYLMNSRLFGKMVRDWHEHRKISRGTWFALGVSAGMTVGFIVWWLL